MKNKKVHIIPHSHWDREWYFSLDESKLLMAYHIANLVKYLKKHKKVEYYNLDGQMSLIEDALDVMPELRVDLYKLIEQKRIIVGPLYTQPDTRIPSLETLARNFDYAKTLVVSPNSDTVYLPDTFGHNIDLPTIIKAAGYDKAVFWRGVDHSKVNNNIHFKWTSPESGEAIKAAFLKNGYTAYGLGYSEGTDIEYRFKTKRMVEDYISSSNQNVVAIPEGSDQLPINNDVHKLIEKLNKYQDFTFMISNWDNYLEKVSFKDVPEYKGSWETGSITRAHKTITATRNDIKGLFYDIESYLTRVVEPLLYFFESEGFSYPSKIVEDVWKDVLTTSAHDSIGLCNTDMVNEDIKDRLIKAKRMIKDLLDVQIKLFVESQDNLKENENLFIFNPTTENIKRVKATITSTQKNFEIWSDNRIDFIISRQTKIPGDLKLVWDEELGEKVITKPDFFVTEIEFAFKTEAVVTKLKVKEVPSEDNTSVENIKDHIKLVEELTFGVMSDKGDSYDYSPKTETETETLIKLEDIKAISFNKITDLSISKFKATISLPKDPLLSDLKVKSNVLISIKEYNGKIKYKLDIDNKSENIRLRLVRKNHGKLKIAKQLSEVDYKNIICPENWRESFKEKPVDIEVFQNYLFTPNKLLVTNSTKEMQADEENIYITIFRSISQFGRADISWRPGRASGQQIKTPKALLKGAFTFEFIEMEKPSSLQERVESIDSLFPATAYQYQKENLVLNQVSRQTILPMKTVRKINYCSLPKGLGVVSIFKINGTYRLRVRNYTDKEIEFKNMTIKPKNIAVLRGE